MHFHFFDVLPRLFLDVLRPLSVLERIDCFLVAVVGGRDSRDHACLCVSTQRVLQQPSQFGITVGDERSSLVFVTQDVDAVPQGEQAFVDIRAFYHSLTSV